MAASEQPLTGPRAVLRVLGLFGALAERAEGAALSDLAKELAVPKSTLANSLRLLTAENYLTVQSGCYRLGPDAYRLAARMMSGWSPLRNIRPCMEALALLTGESVALAQIDRDARQFVFVDVVESGHGVRYVMQPGRRGPLHASASGRVLLAFEPDEFQEAYLATAPFEALTPHTVTEASVLRRQLALVRQKHIHTAVGEAVEDGAAVAAPVFGLAGNVVGALVVAGPTARVKRKRNEIEAALVDAANRVSGRVTVTCG